MTTPIPAAQTGEPRHQAGANPQHLLVTIMGDFWSRSDAGVPSAGLVALLEDFAISPASARSALSRLASRGVLVAAKQGRRTFYRLSPTTNEVGRQSLPGILRFGAAPDEHAPWNGRWSVIAFSTPAELAEVRSALRAKLRWFGFTPLQDGVWIGVHPVDAALRAALAETGEQYVTAFEADLGFPESLRARAPLSSAHLEQIRQQYEGFLAEYTPWRDRSRAGSLTDAEAFVVRERAVDAWRGLFRADPRLPAELLPEDWPRSAASEILVELHDALGPAAERHCRAVLAPFALTDAQQPRHRTSRETAAADR